MELSLFSYIVSSIFKTCSIFKKHADKNPLTFLFFIESFEISGVVDSDAKMACACAVNFLLSTRAESFPKLSATEVCEKKIKVNFYQLLWHHLCWNS